MKAWLQKKKDAFHLRVQIDGQELQRSLGKIDSYSAKSMLGTVCGAIRQIEQGLIQLPSDYPPVDFLINGGKRLAKRAEAIKAEQAIEEYLAYESEEAAASYLGAQRTHLKQLAETVTRDRDLRTIRSSDLETFLRTIRQKKSAQTAIRTRNTIKKFFAWALKHEKIESSPAAGLPVIRDDRRLKPFRTVSQIEESISRGNLSDAAAKQLWKSVFLSVTEIAALLSLVKSRASDQRSYLLHAIAAYTGMRRGEMLRLGWSDVDFEQHAIVARSRKQSRSRRETPRRIELHPELEAILVELSKQRLSGDFVICDPEDGKPLNIDQSNRLFWRPLRGTAWCLDSKKSWFRIGFHTYRHSFVSNLAAAGVDQRVIRDFVGHTSDQMQFRYLHLFPGQRQSAIRKLSFLEKNGSEDAKAS